MSGATPPLWMVFSGCLCRKACGLLSSKTMPPAAGRFFQTCSGFACHVPHGGMADVMRKAQRRAQMPHLRAFGVGLRPQAVMDGADMRAPVLTGSEQGKDDGQGGGVRPSGDRQQQRLPA